LSWQSRLHTISVVGRCVVGVVVCALAVPASADTPVTSPVAPESSTEKALPPIRVRPVRPEDSWYATLTPAALATPSPSRSGVVRGGLVALAGVTQTPDATMGRVDIGVPTPTSQFQRLRTLVITELGTGTDGAAEARDVALTPELQYDWRLPFALTDADINLLLGAGVQWRRHWVRLPDEPFWPSSWESTTAWGARLATSVQYRREGGLVLSLDLSATVPLNTPPPPDSRWMATERDMRYAASILAGYQFQ